MIKEVRKLIAYFYATVKRNFLLQDWMERLQAIFMGLVAGITLNIGEPVLTGLVLLAALVDPKWFKE
jgi:hypothetical protein